MLNPDYKSILNSIDSVILLSNALFKINIKKKKKARNDTIFPPQTCWFLCKLPRDSSHVFQSRKDSMKQGFSLTWLSCFKFHFVIHASPILGRCIRASAWGMQLSSIIPDKKEPKLHPIRETVQKIRYSFFQGQFDFCLHVAQKSLQKGSAVLGTF